MPIDLKLIADLLRARDEMIDWIDGAEETQGRDSTLTEWARMMDRAVEAILHQPEPKPVNLPDDGLPPVKEEAVNFYMVWTKTGRSPRFIHHKEEAAVTEAQRLARLNPGKKFIVLAAKRKFSVPAVVAATPVAELETV